MENSFSFKVHWVRISIYDRQGGELIDSLFWSNLPYPVRQKFNWYFKYRAALAQVQNPKAFIDFRWGNEEAKNDQLSTLIKNRIRAKKAKLTQYKSLMFKAKATWSQIFPIENEPDYIKASAKISKLELELAELESTLRN